MATVQLSTAAARAARCAELDRADRRLLREMRRTWDTLLGLSMRRERYVCMRSAEDDALRLARIEQTLAAQRLVEGELTEMERQRDRIRAELDRLEPEPEPPPSGPRARVIVRALPAPAPAQLSLLTVP